MRVVLLGPPGSGKGTQAERLRAARGVLHLSSGDLLREAVALGTELGLKAKDIMDRGELVPDDVVLSLIGAKVNGVADKFLLDGFPRTRAQAEQLDRLLGDDRSIDHVVALEVPEADVIKRLEGRRTCSGCGRIHNLHTDPPNDAGRCGTCDGELTLRADDNAETIRQRMGVYREQTRPLLDFYRDAGLLRIVDGAGDPDSVAERVRAAIGAAS